MTRLFVALGVASMLAAFSLGLSAQPVTPDTADFAEGEVRKIDYAAGKLTIRHGEIRNIGMPPMTMVFRVTDLAVLSQLKAGDKVRFTAVEKDAAYLVTQIEAAR